ncbi:MAG: sensor domain-containing diguanylate cyclase [Candidatus Thiodiazotropha sp.]
MFAHKRRLLILISLLLVAGFLLTSVTSYFISLNSLRRHVIDAELPLTSDNIYSEIQRDLLQPIFISSLMATDTFLRDWSIRGEKDPSEVTRYLKAIQKKYNAFTAFYVSDKSLNYYHAGGLLKQVSRNNKRDRWYFRLREVDEAYEINVDVDMANNDAMTVFVNYRVFDYDGNFIGATGIGLAVEAVRKSIGHYQTTYNRDVFFIDESGGLKLSGATTNASQERFRSIGRAFVSRGLADKLKVENTITFDCYINGEKLLVNARFIKEFDWYLLVADSEIKGHEEILESLLINLAACTFIILIVLAIIHRTVSTYQHEVERLATNDKLTGLYNRQAMDLLFQQTVLELNRDPGNFSIILFDVDNFKQINDEKGHLGGDAVLQHLAKICKFRMRGTDTLSRWGGEEFVVLLKGCNLDEAVNIAEELRLSVLNNPTSYRETEIKVTISLGVTKYLSGESQDEVMERADKALYRAKHNGKNRVEVAYGRMPR